MSKNNVFRDSSDNYLNIAYKILDRIDSYVMQFQSLSIKNAIQYNHFYYCGAWTTLYLWMTIHDKRSIMHSYLQVADIAPKYYKLISKLFETNAHTFANKTKRDSLLYAAGIASSVHLNHESIQKYLMSYEYYHECRKQILYEYGKYLSLYYKFHESYVPSMSLEELEDNFHVFASIATILFEEDFGKY